MFNRPPTHEIPDSPISFDRNRYSVMAKAARRPIQVRAYADRIIVRCGDAVVAEQLPRSPSDLLRRGMG